jgi:ribosomal protein L40E
VLFIVCALAFAMTGKFLLRMVTSLADPRLELQGEVIDEVRESLLREKKLLTEGLKELQSDYAAGKVDELDYQALRDSAEDRALEVIKHLKNQDAHWLAVARRTAGLSDKAKAAMIAKSKPENNRSTSRHTKVPPADARVFHSQPVEFIDQKCDHCGALNPVDAKFCISCGGQKLEARQEV